MKITNEVFNIIGRIARSFNKTTGLEYDDLYSEGLLAYCLHIHKYNPEKSKLSTFLYHTINNHITSYIRKSLASHYKHIAKDVDYRKINITDTEFLHNSDQPIKDKFLEHMY